MKGKKLTAIKSTPYSKPGPSEYVLPNVAVRKEPTPVPIKQSVDKLSKSLSNFIVKTVLDIDYKDYRLDLPRSLSTLLFSELNNKSATDLLICQD